MNPNYFNEKDGEQKPTIIPKFRVSDTIKNKKTNEIFTISDYSQLYEYYHDINHSHEIKFSEQDDWELVEQKPTETTDLRTWKYIVDAVLTEREDIGQYIDSSWTIEVAKKLQKRFGIIEQKSVEWSEEDKRILSGLSGLVKDCYLNGGYALSMDEYDEYKKWFKSFKERVLPQPKPEWSEEDKDIIDSLVLFLENELSSSQTDEDRKLFKRQIEIVKFFHPQPRQEWSEEDKIRITHLISLVEHHHDKEYDYFDYSDLANWLKSLKDRVQPKPKQEWSKKDEEILNLIIARLHSHPNVESEEYGKDYHWFKSLKDRILQQPKQEVNKEDENNILFLTSIIEEYFKDKEKITLCGDTVCANFTKEDVIDKLKSLRPQNKYVYNPYKAVVESIAEMCKHYDKASHIGLIDFYDNVKVKCKDAKEYDSLYPQNTWKPSLAQLNALSIVSKGNAPDDIEAIVSLYNILKKLMEE